MSEIRYTNNVKPSAREAGLISPHAVWTLIKNYVETNDISGGGSGGGDSRYLSKIASDTSAGAITAVNFIQNGFTSGGVGDYGSKTLTGLTDVDIIGTPDAGKVLVADGDGTWSFGDATASGVSTFKDLTDVNITTYSANYFLKLNGAGTEIQQTQYVNAVYVGTGAVSNTEFNYLNGVTSAIQTQFTGKEPADATILKDADIGVTVQAYSVNNALKADVTYETLNTNLDVGTTSTQVARGNHTHASLYEPLNTNIAKLNDSTPELGFLHIEDSGTEDTLEVRQNGSGDIATFYEDTNERVYINRTGLIVGDDLKALSDISLKDYIIPAKGLYKKALAIGKQLFQYYRNDKDEFEQGFIAQWLDKVAPEYVSKPEKEGRLWSVSYNKLVVPLYGAMMEQDKRIKKLESRIKQLERK